MSRERMVKKKEIRPLYFCPNCGRVLSYNRVRVSQLGLVECDVCGYKILLKVPPKTRKIILGV